MTRMLATVAALALLTPWQAHAACSFANDTPIKALTVLSDAWTAVTDAMAECGNVDVAQRRHAIGWLPADLATDPSAFHLRSASSATLAELIDQKAVRPLDDLVAKYGAHLSPRELIEIDGNIMAIAISLKAEHLVYRRDILEENGITEAPGTYDQVLSMATVLQDAGTVDYPFASAYSDGWHLGLEFLDLYTGFGGALFSDDKTPSINNETGAKTLTMMKALSGFMPVDFLEADPAEVWQQVLAGHVGMAVLPPMDRNTFMAFEASPIADKLMVEAAPRLIDGGNPGTMLWWDGFVIAATASDEEAEAAFQVALEGVDEEMATANPDTALWLVNGFEPGPLARGTIASVIAGATPYPTSRSAGLMQAILGDHLAAFLTGSKTAEETLAIVEQAYLSAARKIELVQ